MSQRKPKANRHSSNRARAVPTREKRLDDGRDDAVARLAPAEDVFTAASSEVPLAAGTYDEPPVASTESAPSQVPPPLTGVVKGTGLPGPECANPQPLRCRLRDLYVVAPGRSCPTHVLRAHVPFEMQLAFDLPRDSGSVGSPVVCEVSVQARRLGSSETSILGRASQNIASATRTVSFRCKGLPLAEGLFRLEATAAVSGPGDARDTAFFNGGLIRVL